MCIWSSSTMSLSQCAVVELEVMRLDIDELATGHLGGAGLDVYWAEPISAADPIRALPNVIATPHVYA